MAVAEPHAEREQRVTALELFFDLVFVFAITQVTAMLADDATWEGLGRAMLVLAAVWWAWAGYTWLTNIVNPEEGGTRLIIFAAMAAFLVMALAVPKAFGSDALVFGVAYFLARFMHLALYAYSARNIPGLGHALLRLAPAWIAAPLILVAVAFVDGPAETALWILALTIDYGTALLAAGDEGWDVAPGHFAERHGLIMIIALGESIVALGIGATRTEAGLTAGVVAAAALGMAAIASLWWLYFDVVAIVAERKLHEATGRARSAMARDSYSFLHLPMVAGVVLFALGLKKTLEHVDEPLKIIPVVGLCGGISLYLLAHIAFRMRNVGSFNWHRLIAAVVILAFMPLAKKTDALVALTVVSGALMLLVTYEALRFREARARVRAAH